MMEVIAANLDRIKTPGPNDKVYKDECFYSFDSPVSHSKFYQIPQFTPLSGVPNWIVHLHELLAWGGQGLPGEIQQEDGQCCLPSHQENKKAS